MRVQPTVQRDSGAYRQGVVLGLTMAEVILLVVFCLLIAAAALLAREHQERTQAMQRAQELEKALVAIVPELARAPADSKIADDWHRLVSAAAQAKANGASLSVLSDADVLVAASNVAQGGLKGAEIEDAVAFAVATAAARGIPIEQLHPEEDLPEGRTANDGHQWPPIISLNEADGYFFETGSAELTQQFRDKIHSEVVATLEKLSEEFGVDVIEVIGHTDERPISGALPSNLDKTLLGVVRGTAPIGDLTPADNAGLGLARAVAVAKELLSDPVLSHRTILPFSAAQLIEVGDHLSDGTSIGDIPERRRIEIRMRRSNDH